MNAFAADPFAPVPAASVTLDVYTTAFRVSGTIVTRFTRVADVLNQVNVTHLAMEQATISEYEDPSATLGAQQVQVALHEVLFCVAATSGVPNPDLRVMKRAVRAQIGVPPFRLTGTIHVPQGTRPIDGLINAADRFQAMTDVAVVCARHPELGRTAGAIAFQRARAQIVLVADDERPDQLLADVLDERTAKDWLSPRELDVNS